MMTIKGSYILEHPHVKAVFKIGAQNGGFSEIWGSEYQI